jgi:hypothetical protein
MELQGAFQIREKFTTMRPWHPPCCGCRSMLRRVPWVVLLVACSPVVRYDLGPGTRGDGSAHDASRDELPRDALADGLPGDAARGEAGDSSPLDAADGATLDAPPSDATTDGSPDATPDATSGALHPDLVLPDPGGETCDAPGNTTVCPFLEVCRIASATSGRCETCEGCGNLFDPCVTNRDCDILFQCFQGYCTNICPLGTYYCGPIEDCIDVGHVTHGVCKPAPFGD